MGTRNPRSTSTTSSLPARLETDWVRTRTLGKGGQAVVAEIQHRRTGECRALKLLKTDDVYHRRRLAREIEALARLAHENVVPLLDHADDASWYVMPVGVPLSIHWEARRVEADDMRPLFDDAMAVIRGVLAGLAAAHALDLVHRDIKPANVLMIDGVPKVADFGIVHDPTQERLTERPAANVFAPHVPSLYDPTHAPKVIDCFGAATLWAWMLAADPRVAHGHYHWRWHRYIDDPRSEIARTLLAVCSDERHAPPDAGACIDFLEREIGVASWPMASVDDDTAAKIAEAQAIARARAKQDQLAIDGDVTAIASSIRSLVEKLLVHYRHVVEQLRTRGVEVYLRQPSARDPHRKETVTKTLDEIVAAAASGPGKNLPIFSLSTRRDPLDASMRVHLFVHWHANPHEDRSKMSIGLMFEHEIPELRRERYFKVLPGGSLLDDGWSGVSNIGPEDIIRLIDEFLLNPDHHV